MTNFSPFCVFLGPVLYFSPAPVGGGGPGGTAAETEAGPADGQHQ
jgi:hypothetical protein